MLRTTVILALAVAQTSDKQYVCSLGLIESYRFHNLYSPEHKTRTHQQIR